MARVIFRSEVVISGEIRYVSHGQLAEAVRQLERDPTAGKPLTRELFGLRSLRVGGSENRLVYRHHLHADPAQQQVEILAIGRRRDDEVYGIATGRPAT